MTFLPFRPAAAALAALLLTTIQPAAQSMPVNVVAIGASNTWGWGVGGRNAYPERLEDMLKAAGFDARVINAGVVLDTTVGMLNRLDAAVPDGTHVVILQPGGNDARFLRSKEHRAANIEEMKRRLWARNIAVIVYDPVFPPEASQWDRIHLTAETHAKIAAELLPQITEIIRSKDKPKKDPAKPKRR
jgi:acyl-CoA thioesterase-1